MFKNLSEVKGLNFIQLFKGDGLEILPESKDFNLKCCSCGFVHHINISHTDEGNIILWFYDEKAKP